MQEKSHVSGENVAQRTKGVRYVIRPLPVPTASKTLGSSMLHLAISTQAGSVFMSSGNGRQAPGLERL
jgi:hypothetical protein